MSECVVRMEMPRSCFNCDLRYECNAFYAPGKPKPFMKGCMIVCQLPEGHGRLGDLDALTRSMLERKQPLIGADSSKDRYRYMQWLADFNAIKDAKTVVPADEYPAYMRSGLGRLYRQKGAKHD